MRLFDRSETAALLPYEVVVRALEEGVRSVVHAPERRHHDVIVPGEPIRTLITMPAWDEAGAIGIKLVNVVPGNQSRGEPSISAAYLLFDRVNGRPVAMLDGTELTARRTAGVAALAGKQLSNPYAEVHLIVGAGAVARHLAPAYRVVRQFARTLVWARRQNEAAKLAESLCDQGFDARPIEDLETGARQADVISCATMAVAPIIQGAWLASGTHVDLLGSYRPGMREADDEALKGAIIYVDSLPGALADTSELSDPIARGVIPASAICGELPALCTTPLGYDPHARTVFKSVGNARWDYYCASAAWRTAVEAS